MTTIFEVTPVIRATESGVACAGAGALAVHMWGKDTANYRLRVNGREYDWPDDSGDIEQHARRIIDFEAAFYDAK